MNSGKRKQIDPVDKAIEAALSPGSFISYQEHRNRINIDNSSSLFLNIHRMLFRSSQCSLTTTEAEPAESFKLRAWTG